MPKKDKVDEILDRLAVDRNSIGGKALRNAVAVCVEDVEFEYKVTKLYADTAEKLSKAVSTIEREIRSAVRKSWTDGDPALLKEMLPAHYGKTEKSPVNALYIAAAAEWIRLNC